MLHGSTWTKTHSDVHHDCVIDDSAWHRVGAQHRACHEDVLRPHRKGAGLTERDTKSGARNRTAPSCGLASEPIWLYSLLPVRYLISIIGSSWYFILVSPREGGQERYLIINIDLSWYLILICDHSRARAFFPCVAVLASTIWSLNSLWEVSGAVALTAPTLDLANDAMNSGALALAHWDARSLLRPFVLRI